MKRMNSMKKMITEKIVGSVLMALTMAIGFTPLTAFAQGEEAKCICEDKCSQDSINEDCAVCLYDYKFCEGKEPETEQEEDAKEEESFSPLTPDGNMNLVDDYGSVSAGGKQFITVTTKSGNYFYIIIDRDDKGTETVYFLNLVDESDLLALMKEEEVESYMNSQGMTQKEKETEEPEHPVEKPTEDVGKEVVEPETNRDSINVTGIMTAVLLAVVGGIGGFIYVKSGKTKKKSAGPDPDADYYDSNDDEDYLAEMDIEEESVADDENEDIESPEIIQDESDEE